MNFRERFSEGCAFNNTTGTKSIALLPVDVMLHQRKSYVATCAETKCLKVIIILLVVCLYVNENAVLLFKDDSPNVSMPYQVGTIYAEVVCSISLVLSVILIVLESCSAEQRRFPARFVHEFMHHTCEYP